MSFAALMLIVLWNASFSGSSPVSLNYVGNSSCQPGIDQIGIGHEGYTYTAGIGGHRVHTTVTTWKTARSICREEGGDLAIINSQAEADVISRLFVESEPHTESYAPGNAWIGTVILPSILSGSWTTIYGDSLEKAGFNEWHEIKAKDGPHCGAVFRDGKLSWFNCARSLGFVCEVPYVESSPDTMETLNYVVQGVPDLNELDSD